MLSLFRSELRNYRSYTYMQKKKITLATEHVQSQKSLKNFSVHDLMLPQIMTFIYIKTSLLEQLRLQI